MGKWDSFSKLLIGARPWQYARWLVPGARLIEALNIELQVQHFLADALLKIWLDGQFGLLHIELQTYEDETMDRRMLEYNVYAEHQHKLPVRSFVIYLRKCKGATSPYMRKWIDGFVVHHFHFSVIKLWQVSSQSIIELGLDGLLPLLSLTKDGKKPEIVQVMIDRLVAGGDKDLLFLAQCFGGLAFTDESEKAAFTRRFAMLQDVLKDSWVYQELRKEAEEQGWAKGWEEGRIEGHNTGHKQGLSEGHNEGRIEGRIEGRKEAQEKTLQLQRQIVVDIVNNRFPWLSTLAAQQVEHLTDLDALRVLVVTIASAQDGEAAHQLLKDAVKE